MNSNQLVLTTSLQAGLLALGLAFFDVGGAWLWLPVVILSVGVILAAQVRTSALAAAIAAALLLWPAAALLDGWGAARIAWLAAPLLYPLVALLGAAASRRFRTPA